jgi:hypothetical protein
VVSFTFLLKRSPRSRREKRLTASAPEGGLAQGAGDMVNRSVEELILLKNTACFLILTPYGRLACIWRRWNRSRFFLKEPRARAAIAATCGEPCDTPRGGLVMADCELTACFIILPPYGRLACIWRRWNCPRFFLKEPRARAAIAATCREPRLDCEVGRPNSRGGPRTAP